MEENEKFSMPNLLALIKEAKAKKQAEENSAPEVKQSNPEISTEITPSAFSVLHPIGTRGWMYSQGVPIECELVSYMVEVAGPEHKSCNPAYKVRFYVKQMHSWVPQETIIRAETFKLTLDEILDEVRKSAVLFPDITRTLL